MLHDEPRRPSEGLTGPHLLLPALVSGLFYFFCLSFLWARGCHSLELLPLVHTPSVSTSTLLLKYLV